MKKIFIIILLTIIFQILLYANSDDAFRISYDKFYVKVSWYMGIQQDELDNFENFWELVSLIYNNQEKLNNKEVTYYFRIRKENDKIILNKFDADIKDEHSEYDFRTIKETINYIKLYLIKNYNLNNPDYSKDLKCFKIIIPFNENKSDTILLNKLNDLQNIYFGPGAGFMQVKKGFVFIFFNEKNILNNFTDVKIIPIIINKNNIGKILN